MDEISGDHQVGVKVVRSAGVLGNVRLSFQVIFIHYIIMKGV